MGAGIGIGIGTGIDIGIDTGIGIGSGCGEDFWIWTEMHEILSSVVDSVLEQASICCSSEFAEM